MWRRRRRGGWRQGDEIQHREREHRRHGGAIAESFDHARNRYCRRHAHSNANAYASGKNVHDRNVRWIDSQVRPQFLQKLLLTVLVKLFHRRVKQDVGLQDVGHGTEGRRRMRRW
jgi:hypothetical protein